MQYLLYRPQENVLNIQNIGLIVKFKFMIVNAN